MKKKTIAAIVLSLAMLMSLFTMGPAPDKTEKLRHDDTSWDKEGGQFVVSMSCKFGIATAGEHAGFRVRTTLTITTDGDPVTLTGETVIQKAEGARKDADGYIAIEPTYIQWDRGGFTGTTSVETSIELVNPGGKLMKDATTSVADITIEPSEELTIDDVTVSEDNDAVFTVTLSSPSSYPTTVDYSTADGTAATGSDYIATSGTVVFAPGETTKAITIPTVDDSLYEGNETFYLNLSNATNANIADAQGIGTIIDNDASPNLSINDVTVTEGGEADFAVMLSSPSTYPVIADFVTVDGTATSDSDYIATFGTVIVPPGNTSITIFVQTIDDALYEGDETFYLYITGAPINATLVDDQGIGTILDISDLPVLSVNDVTVNEDTGDAIFTVTLSAPSSFPITVDYSTADGTATAGIDYIFISGTLTFPPGQTSNTISVPINEDVVYEGDETFYLNLSNPTNAIISNAQGIGTILDNDVLPTLTGKIITNEIGLESLRGSYVEILNLVSNASDTTLREMAELELIIVGADGRVTHIHEGFINDTIPAGGTMVIYENGTLEIRNKYGNVKNIGADVNWVDDADIYIDGQWEPYDPNVHDLSFGDTTADPLLTNLLQNGVSIDYFTANNPSANLGAPVEDLDIIYSGSWYPPAGAAGNFVSFDGSLTDDLVFERVFREPGIIPFVYEPGEIDSHTAADWTTSNTPTEGALNPTQIFWPGIIPDVDDGQTVVFGTEGADTIESEAGPDFLFGEGGDDALIGGEGDDHLDGGAGDDDIYGGPGDDLIVEKDFNAFAGTIDGGEGTDTWVFTTDSDVASLQLANSYDVSAQLSGLEILDMRDGQVGDSLTITKDVVNAFGVNNDHTSSITPTSIPPVYVGKVDIYVRGDAQVADTVNLQGAGWTLAGDTITLGSEVYDILVNGIDVDEAVIAIQQGVTVNAP